MSGSMMSDNFPDLHHKVRPDPNRLGVPWRPAPRAEPERANAFAPLPPVRPLRLAPAPNAAPRCAR